MFLCDELADCILGSIGMVRATFCASFHHQFLELARNKLQWLVSFIHVTTN